MKYIKYGFYSIVSKPLFNIIIMIELAAILFTGNIVISIVNSRSVFYEPYAEILEHEGYVFTPRITKNNNNLKKVYDSLQGNVEIVYSYEMQIMTDSKLLEKDFFSDDIIKYRNLVSFNDSIFSKFHLPLTSGRWASSHKNSNNQIEVVAVTARENNLKVGDVFHFYLQRTDQDNKQTIPVDMGEMIIVGTIAKGNYYPTIMIQGKELGSNGKKNTRDVRNMYTVGSSETENASFLVSAAVATDLCDDKYMNFSTVFIYYNSEPTDKIRNANKEILAGTKGNYITMSEFKKSSDLYLYEQYIKILPILLGIFVIVCAELICSVALNTKKQIRNYGIYFLCGCRWKDCLKISISYSSIILFCSVILGAISFIFFQNTDYSTIFEQNYNINNVFITLGIIFTMLIVSLIIPIFVVKNTSPIENFYKN